MADKLKVGDLVRPRDNYYARNTNDWVGIVINDPMKIYSWLTKVQWIRSDLDTNASNLSYYSEDLDKLNDQ